jgi:hypothetical protein
MVNGDNKIAPGSDKVSQRKECGARIRSEGEDLMRDHIIKGTRWKRRLIDIHLAIEDVLQVMS